jgi:tetratricopeptide (TPR) repeat protein
LLIANNLAEAQRHCADGDHFPIDLKQVRIQYDASSFAGTLSSLNILGARLEVKPDKLQEASAAAQQWDELLKGLVAGYNTCAVTRQQYADGLTRIYPRLKDDAISLEEIRKLISDGHKADEKRLHMLLDGFYANLRQFAHTAGQDIILERIEALSEEVESSRRDILRQQKKDTGSVISQQQTDTDKILEKLSELERKQAEAPPPTPEVVSTKISEIRRDQPARADAAEASYRKGYELLDRFHFRQAIPYLERALDQVRLPEFYLALADAYLEISDLNHAESLLRDALKSSDSKNEGALDAKLAIVLASKGDSNGALDYAKQALKVDEVAEVPAGRAVASDKRLLANMYQTQGKSGEALSYAQNAEKMDERLYSGDDVEVGDDMATLSTILQRANPLDALRYAQRALAIHEDFYGSDSARVAADTINLSAAMAQQGQRDQALIYAQRGLNIAEKVYGDDHPMVAAAAENFGAILQSSDLDGALKNYQRALKIDENVYGHDHPNAAGCRMKISVVLRTKGDLRGALDYAKQGLESAEKFYKAPDPHLVFDAFMVGLILNDMGDLDGTLSYFEQAFKIAKSLWGPEDSHTKDIAQAIKELKDKKQP